jgi:hypothetical protein
MASELNVGLDPLDVLHLSVAKLYRSVGDHRHGYQHLESVIDFRAGQAAADAERRERAELQRRGENRGQFVTYRVDTLLKIQEAREGERKKIAEILAASTDDQDAIRLVRSALESPLSETMNWERVVDQVAEQYAYFRMHLRQLAEDLDEKQIATGFLLRVGCNEHDIALFFDRSLPYASRQIDILARTLGLKSFRELRALMVSLPALEQVPEWESRGRQARIPVRSASPESTETAVG